ncbi:alpha hydrolase [Halomicrobium katesii]|uniref:alpha hydrolase n=1 Tax=Halomicrobium katesii TaxID=437163 RepID=UPI00036584BD|nr:alpha hydrolase [Halomicrobium katesii]
MRCGVLYSGGKDSTLAALVLEPFYEVTLVTATFGIADVVAPGRRAAAAAGFDFETIDLDPTIAEAAVERMVTDGYPRTGIQRVHEHAVETIADAGFPAIADGTRRDDRVPTIDRSVAQSVEDRFGVDYLAPLSGFGRDAIDALVEQHLRVETGPSEAIPKADYETELRALMREEHGAETVADVFPEHTQSRVVGRR